MCGLFHEATNKQCVMLIQPFTAGPRLAASVLLRPVQPTDRGAAQVPPQGPL